MTVSHPDVIPFPGRPQGSAGLVESPAVPPPILIVTSDAGLSSRLAGDVQALGLPCRVVSTVDAAVQSLQQCLSEVCLIGLLPPGNTSGQLAGQINQRGWPTQCATIGQIDAPGQQWLEVLPLDASREYLGLMLAALSQQCRILAENRRLRKQLANRNLRDLVGQSSAMQTLRQQIQQAAEQSGGVLLRGEPGTGADVVAQAIHDASRRAHRPFIKLDCSVLSADSMEQELVGAATPAGVTTGRLAAADGGTLMFDQVQCLALPIQRKLLTMLREQRFEHPVTGERIRFDVRIIFSTPSDLSELAERGLFRPELLAEGCQTLIHLPSLRSRVDDIGLLAEHFLRKIAAREGRPVRSITVEALHLLQQHDWPGNVRELENVLERACSLDWGTRLTAGMLQPWLAQTEADNDCEVPGGLTLSEMERKLIEATFVRFNGNREKTAKALQIGIRTLSGKLREYGYPPRGGPGSNLQPWPRPAETPADGTDSLRRAA
jgi:DNA-binding NtrC family response regulator